MARNRNLKTAPITEALIDIRVKLPSELGLPKLDFIHSFFEKEYPIKKERIKIEGKFDAKTKESSTTSITDGFLCSSGDNTQGGSNSGTADIQSLRSKYGY